MLSLHEISLGFSSEACSCFVLNDLRLIGKRFVTIAERLSDPWEQGPESNRRNAFVAYPALLALSAFAAQIGRRNASPLRKAIALPER
jgi:hypothetical protein